MGELDMNLNFSMTDAGEHFGNFSHLGGIVTDGLYGGQLNDGVLEKKKAKGGVSKKKAGKSKNKAEAQTGNSSCYFILEPNIDEKQIALNNE